MITTRPLDGVALDTALTEEAYDRALLEQQARLRELARRVYKKGLPCVFAFEGWDAAGKGGAIRRLTQPLDPRGYEVHAIAAPEGDDKSRHYLYRFWRRLPAGGRIAVFDRTWYGRVLVERVEGYAREAEWRRAFDEINAFERQLVRSGVAIAKFWLHLSAEEQLRRFEARRIDPLRSYKLTDEDWRNREKWAAYDEAVNEMIARTSTEAAPWTVVSATDKLWARIRVLETCTGVIERALERRPS